MVEAWCKFWSGRAAAIGSTGVTSHCVGTLWIRLVVSRYIVLTFSDEKKCCAYRYKGQEYYIMIMLYLDVGPFFGSPLLSKKTTPILSIFFIIGLLHANSMRSHPTHFASFSSVCHDLLNAHFVII